MPTLQNALISTLTSEVVAKAEKSVIKSELPKRRLFDIAVRIGNANSLDRLRWLCEVAESKPTATKIDSAKKALLDFVGKYSNPKASASRQLTKEQFELLSEYYVLSLPCVGWATATQVWDTCYKMQETDNWENMTTRWC